MDDNEAVCKLISDFTEVSIIPFSGEGWFSVTDKFATKWRGICALSAHYNIGISDIVAFGDDYNDVEMLRGCGIGVAVANAIKEASPLTCVIFPSKPFNIMATMNACMCFIWGLLK